MFDRMGSMRECGRVECLGDRFEFEGERGEIVG